MSWDCPHLSKDICKLNGITCKPAKGNCILRGKVEIVIPSKTKNQEPEDKSYLFKDIDGTNQ